MADTDDGMPWYLLVQGRAHWFIVEVHFAGDGVLHSFHDEEVVARAECERLNARALAAISEPEPTMPAGLAAVGDEVWGRTGWDRVTAVGFRHLDGGPFPHTRVSLTFESGGELETSTEHAIALRKPGLAEAAPQLDPEDDLVGAVS